MVDEQLIPRGISDPRVLEAFRGVPRHRFVTEALSGEAYADHPLPIGEGQTISQPYMVAIMTQCLKLKGAESVLEIGTGSGYQTAILAELAKKVYSVERFPALADRARAALGELGYKNIEIKTGDGSLGWEERGPYDAIIVTAGAPEVPHSLVRQLADNGRLALPVGGAYSQALTVIEKKKGAAFSTEICGCVFVPLIGEEGWKEGVR
jgi:protein-L-isoaspartate(D-aspartate) O-methyltransferase